MKLTREHLIVARQFGFTERHIIEELIRVFDQAPIAALIQMSEAEPRMVVALRHATYLKEMADAGMRHRLGNHWPYPNGPRDN